LTPAQQESAKNAVRAIGLSPDAGDVYQQVQTTGGRLELIYALFGLRVVVLYRKKWLGPDVEVVIRGVFPSDLRSESDYEEETEQRRSRPPHRRRRRNVDQ
jgi:hypothetical protein